MQFNTFSIPAVKSNDAEDLLTQSAIAIYPISNHVGLWTRMLLSTDDFVTTRSQFTKLPCPNIVIAKMNEMYESDEKAAREFKNH